jgi:hypothetical protein
VPARLTPVIPARVGMCKGVPVSVNNETRSDYLRLVGEAPLGRDETNTNEG